MPSVNLRLTDAEHAQLRDAAHDNRRSLQGEITFRLFPKATPEAREERLTREEAEEHFRPDFGTKLKK